MAIDYTDLFTLRIKSIVTAYQTMKTWYADLATIRGDVGTKMVSADSENLIGPVFNALQLSELSAESAVSTVGRSVDLILTDNTTILTNLPQLTSLSASEVAHQLVADMNVESESVAASAITVGSVTTTTQNSNAGTLYTSTKLDGISNPAIYAKANREYANITSQLALTSDAIVVTCTSDSETDRATKGKETFTVSGRNYDVLYGADTPGNGGAVQIRTAQASSVVDLSFDTFTANVPNGWTTVAGTAGTSFLAENTEVVYATGNSLEIAGNCELKIPIRSAVSVLGHYLAGFLVKSDGLVSGATLNIFIEGTGYTTEASGTNEIVMNATALNAQTAFAPEQFSVVFPNNLPSDLTLRIEVTGMSAGKIYLDFGFLSRLTYVGGIALGVIAGREVFLRGDRFAFDLSNDDAGDYQQFFRDFYGVQLPTSGSPTQAF